MPRPFQPFAREVERFRAELGHLIASIGAKVTASSSACTLVLGSPLLTKLVEGAHIARGPTASPQFVQLQRDLLAECATLPLSREVAEYFEGGLDMHVERVTDLVLERRAWIRFCALLAALGAKAEDRVAKLRLHWRRAACLYASVLSFSVFFSNDCNASTLGVWQALLDFDKRFDAFASRLSAQAPPPPPPPPPREEMGSDDPVIRAVLHLGVD
jgi:hypothetical protein